MTPPQPARELQLNLLQNGLDFVREGAEALYGASSTNEPRAYKYALLHMFSGTLLLLKEKLRRAHPSLIFADVAMPANADAKTVDFDTALKRLAGAAGVILDRPDQELLRRVQKQRNCLEHFEVKIQVEHADALVGELVEFLERFLREQLDDSLFHHVSPSAGSEIAELAQVARGLRERALAEWRSRAAKYAKVGPAKLKKLAAQNEYHPKHNPDVTVRECPVCGRDSVVDVEKDVALCTDVHCRAVHRTVSCMRCGSRSFDDFCEECRSYIQYQVDQD